jgi:predicted DNA-binding protein with PD1-like motif
MIEAKVGVSGGRFLAFRLAPGTELLGALRRVVAANGIRAGYVAGVPALRGASRWDSARRLFRGGLARRGAGR